MRVSTFRICLVVLYLTGFFAVGYSLWFGWDYYSLPMSERPHSENHALLKPGGLLGHGFGIIGSSMLVLLFVYSVRKRGRFGLRYGKMSRWLDVHIWFGIMGPLLITLHTAMKFHGIVSIGYFSMLAVMISGFLGRYIYMQIPRDEAGNAMSIQNIDKEIKKLGDLLMSTHGIPSAVLDSINARAVALGAREARGLTAIAVLAKADLIRFLEVGRLRTFVRKSHPEIPAKGLSEIVRLSKQKTSLMRRRAVLGVVNSVFHYWHVIHKPFATVMVLIMFVHIVVTVLMGYKWIF